MRARLLLASLLLASVSFAPRVVEACGGTFCDSGPNQMPVDQRGENILFVMDGQNVEAHIQIQYQGDAKRFAWVLPLQAVPELGIGSQILFDRLLAASVPTYGYNSQVVCDFDGSNGFGATGGGPVSGGDAGAGGSTGGGPTVVLKQTVGAFDVTVLQGGTSQEVLDWLNTNGYAQSPAAGPILDTYLEQNYVFAAVKLTGGAGVDEIHPLVVKYPGTKPCVPLRLTAIAAVENMGVRTFFLGNDRVVPTNYRSVVLNPARIDFAALGANYEDVVIHGVDSAIANGHAFITEYAGSSSSVSPFGIYSTSWSATPFPGLAPESVIQTLTNQGLVDCMGGASCQWNHPLLRGLVNEYLPVPAGVSEDAFYGCLSCYKDKIDATLWDGAKFGQTFIERIIQPGKHAQDLLGAWPYLTRLYTTISPAEMTEDPDFEVHAGLDPVTNIQTGSRELDCNGTALGIRVPDGRPVALDANGAWPGWTDSMPWVERVEEFPAGSAPVSLVDNTAAIKTELDAWNASRGWPKEPGQTGGGGATSTGGANVGGATTAGTGGSATGTGASSPGTGGTGGSSPSGLAATPASAGDDDGGCDVSTRGAGSGTAALLLGMIAALATRRRRNRP
jgi:MYXO-CTERM domain-containing protein